MEGASECDCEHWEVEGLSTCFEEEGDREQHLSSETGSVDGLVKKHVFLACCVFSGLVFDAEDGNADDDG